MNDEKTTVVDEGIADAAIEGVVDGTGVDKGGDASPFGGMEGTPENHFALHFHAAVHVVIACVRHLRRQGGEDADETFDDYPFLGHYLDEHLRFLPEDLTWREGGPWWLTAIRRWEAGAEGHLPIRALSRELGLSAAQRLAFVLAGLQAEDSRFGTLFADLQAPVQSRRPTVELLGRVLQFAAPERGGWPVFRPLVEAGLVEVVDRSRPHAEWELRVPFVLWDAARGTVPERIGRGESEATVQAPGEATAFDDLILPEDARERLQEVPGLLSREGTRIVALRGTPGSDRLAALSAVAREMGRGVVTVSTADRQTSDGSAASLDLPDAIGPFCVLTRTMPVLEIDLGPGESRSLPAMPGYDGPIGVALGESGGLTGEALDAAVTLSLGTLSAEERRRHWQAAIREAGGTVEADALTAIVDGFQLPGRYLRRAGAGAVRQAALDGRDAVQVADVRRATRSLGRQLLDTLAERIDAEGSWDHLIVDPMAEDKLRALERRCHHRERLLDHLGPAFGGSTTKGVRALFAGPSGTGKTLAARILAAELGMDLYRVDLAAVINKYVGETEKNLHRVLSTAEELDVILLLDEGDALLGKRTDVSSANDRYANVETNYLLQRLEHYRGIVLVTSNLADNIDPAFQRRMDLVVDFAPPSPDERLGIWQIHLPEEHAVSESLLRRVARECALNGGQIRNAALTATLRAVDEAEGEAPDADAPSRASVTVRDEHVTAAVREEYRKDGALCPLTTDDDRAAASTSGAQQFVEGMTG
jgi:hypothetical protein